VTLVVANNFGAAGAKHIAMALRALTGLQHLSFSGACFVTPMLLLCLCLLFYCLE
jgi:hypothetical protein